SRAAPAPPQPRLRHSRQLLRNHPQLRGGTYFWPVSGPTVRPVLPHHGRANGAGSELVSPLGPLDPHLRLLRARRPAPDRLCGPGLEACSAHLRLVRLQRGTPLVDELHRPGLLPRPALVATRGGAPVPHSPDCRGGIRRGLCLRPLPPPRIELGTVGGARPWPPGPEAVRGVRGRT